MLVVKQKAAATALRRRGPGGGGATSGSCRVWKTLVQRPVSGAQESARCVNTSQAVAEKDALTDHQGAMPAGAAQQSTPTDADGL